MFQECTKIISNVNQVGKFKVDVIIYYTFFYFIFLASSVTMIAQQLFKIYIR